MKKTFLLIILFVSLAGIASAATGQLTYTPLEPLPGTVNGWGETQQLPALLSALFKLLITFGSLFAVVMLVVAGIGYMVSEAAVDIQKAKDRAVAALWGLLLLTGCWLILYTINPDLLKFNLNIPMAPGGTYTGGSSLPGSTDRPSSNSTPCGNNPNNAAGCSADSYCGQLTVLVGGTSDTCIPNTDRAASKNCEDSGGSWYSDMSGSYCYLSAVKTEGECGTAGGKWQSRWLTTSYCYK